MKSVINTNKIIVVKDRDKIDSQAIVLWLISDAYTCTICIVFTFGSLKAKHFL